MATKVIRNYNCNLTFTKDNFIIFYSSKTFILMLHDSTISLSVLSASISKMEVAKTIMPVNDERNYAMIKTGQSSDPLK